MNDFNKNKEGIEFDEFCEAVKEVLAIEFNIKGHISEEIGDWLMYAYEQGETVEEAIMSVWATIEDRS